MWTHHFEQETNQSIENLWTVLADVRNWDKIDENIQKLTIDSEPKKGTIFKLKPKGAPTLKFEIVTFKPPYEYADMVKMPGAKMITLHTFKPIEGNKTIIGIDIEIKGPLSWIWGNTVGKTHAEGMPALTEKFIQAANKLK